MIDFLLRPIRRNFGRDRAYYRIVDDLFGFIPHNVELYKLALIHKSASLVLEDGRAINNERLEYLGDAVIEAVTSDYLFIEYPDRDEGFMTQLRSKIVSRQRAGREPRSGCPRDFERRHGHYPEAYLRRRLRGDDGGGLPRSGVRVRQPAADQ